VADVGRAEPAAVRLETEVNALGKGVNRGDRKRARAYNGRVVPQPANDLGGARRKRRLDRLDQRELVQRCR
jgi:hypothetical protein